MPPTPIHPCLGANVLITSYILTERGSGSHLNPLRIILSLQVRPHPARGGTHSPLHGQHQRPKKKCCSPERLLEAESAVMDPGWRYFGRVGQLPSRHDFFLRINQLRGKLADAAMPDRRAKPQRGDRPIPFSFRRTNRESLHRPPGLSRKNMPMEPIALQTICPPAPCSHSSP